MLLQLYQKALKAASQLTSELQSRNKRLEQLQASRDEMVSIADAFRGIVTKLEPAANHGRMMAALLEMLLTRTKIPADKVAQTHAFSMVLVSMHICGPFLGLAQTVVV